jgi:hypothetical protein
MPVAADGAGARPAVEEGPPPVTANRRAFTVMVRNACFRRVEMLALRNYAALGQLDGASGWTAERWEQAAAEYFAEHDSIGIDARARSAELVAIDTSRSDGWLVTQTLLDPADFNEWVLRLRVDLEASDATGEAVVHMEDLQRL